MFKFRWYKVSNERILLSIKNDPTERNIWSNGEEFPRWTEFGLRGDLMRLTDYGNSQKEPERRRLSAFATIGWKSASQETLDLLWAAAKNKIPIAWVYSLDQ
jgi:hypothetical protein